MNLEELYNKITLDLEREAIKKFESRNIYIKWNEEIYKKYGYKKYRLTVPEINKVIKKFIEDFKDLSFNQSINLSKQFYKSEYIAQTSFGLKLLELNILSIRPQKFEILDDITNYLKDWGPTDAFSIDIMQPLLRMYPNETIDLLSKWNASSFIWKKRVSLVTFTRKIGSEGEYVDFLLKLCDNLLWDEEDLVRKAIGWALKDNMVGNNKQKVFSYVKKLRKIGVSSTITLYAIRNLKGKERNEIIKIKSDKSK